ncbi:hypothetical protein [uncultured Desulfosarcina sp.]|uniref:hypothetical protein n=1 Tax=uncultured Desulfosarcina sp. TaxID=218289 RepID=UPI0029C70FDD|nr:hypothetical protein [uncultured Desulfosarcina sp.]
MSTRNINQIVILVQCPANPENPVAIQAFCGTFHIGVALRWTRPSALNVVAGKQETFITIGCLKTEKGDYE